MSEFSGSHNYFHENMLFFIYIVIPLDSGILHSISIQSCNVCAAHTICFDLSLSNYPYPVAAAGFDLLNAQLLLSFLFRHCEWYQFNLQSLDSVDLSVYLLEITRHFSLPVPIDQTLRVILSPVLDCMDLDRASAWVCNYCKHVISATAVLFKGDVRSKHLVSTVKHHFREVRLLRTGHSLIIAKT